MYYLGIDLGGTNIAVGVVDENCKIIKKGSVPTNADREADAIIRDMADLCIRLHRRMLADPRMTSPTPALPTPGTANRDTERSFTRTIFPS